ncbi:hypothetical protein [Pontibacter sp. SGAir0037]|uniref:hypothetical protein n=1 Tax=Pontibacter sp. SGAir0037 TaxID=2571030 RepID=UPI0010CCD759|nr:hypothetical protein [Pontibacter sp. SGAir0037]QCR23780.1 hypothetical protein C1N53_16440 [Pontibacter sp. SGAir0037]
MKKHKLTPAMDDALKQFAERLPVPETKYRTPQKGHVLLADDPNLLDAKGNPLDPEKEYYIGSPTNATNHLRRLRKAFRDGGKDAVVEYLRPYESFLAQE